MPFDIHCHVHERGSAEIDLNLVFRDYLRSCEEDRIRYQDHKASLAQDPGSILKLRSDLRAILWVTTALSEKFLRRRVLMVCAADFARITTSGGPTMRFVLQLYVLNKKAFMTQKMRYFPVRSTIILCCTRELRLLEWPTSKALETRRTTRRCT